MKQIITLLLLTLTLFANIPPQITYDDRHQPLVVEYEDGSVVTYTYDEAGNITKIETPTQTITKTYDALNRLKSVTDAQGTITYDYDAIGRQTQITYPNGITTSYEYDSRNRVTKIEHKKSDGTILQSFAYTYDAVGNRIKVVEHTGRTVEYEYNSVNQLTKETVTNDPNGNNTTTTYTYDAVGNLVGKTIDGITTEYSYNANDQLTQKGFVTYTYDANGNLLSDGTNAYEYDAKNRLIKVTTPTETIEYSYDANDNRIAKVVNGDTTTYLIDPNTPYAQVITESKENGTEIHYTYGHDLLSDGSHTFLSDALGSTRALADSSGQITDSYDYTPYGELRKHSGTSDTPFLFTGEQYDKETGNYYLRARYYSPELARFLTRDTYDGTLTDPLSQNHYLYARGNPVIYVDPSGRCFVAGAIDMLMVVDIMGPLRSSEIRYQSVRGAAMAGRASEIVLNSGHTVRALRAMRRSNRGLFERLENFLGEKVEIHHILEKRFYNNANKEVREILDRIADADDLPGIVLTKSRHRIITNRWVEALKRERMNGFVGYSKITPEMLINAAQKVYYDDPIQMRVVVDGLFNAMMKL